MTERIYLSPPDVGVDEEAAVARAIRSGWVAPLGPEVDAFEQELAALGGREHCVALSSGTAALHLALLSLGVGPGDHVVTSTMTFAATVNAIVYTGATPVLVDCGEDGNINPGLLDQALAQLAAQGQRVPVVMPVDLLGKVVDHERIAAVAERFGATVVSDAAESVGASRDHRSALSFGRAAAVSFNGNKIMTTSGGGALLTDDAALAARVRHLSTQAREPAAHYEHVDVGYNYRLSNVLAALGRTQLARLGWFVAKRRALRDRYAALVADLPGVQLFGEPSQPAPGTSDNCWLTAVLIDSELAGFTRDQLIVALADDNIEARPLWKPMHAQPVFRHLPAELDGTSERIFAQGVTLPSGSSLTDEQFERVASVIVRVAGGHRARL